jgi:hypothetical protein
MSSHIGRAYAGHAIEDACPCPKTACGLVSLDAQDPDCPEHAFNSAKTMRQGHLHRDCPALSPLSWAAAQLATLDTVIAYIESTAEEDWNVDTVRSKDGTKNCFFGHLFNMTPDEDRANALWGMFEDLWSTTYRIYPINDGTNPRYPQETPKQRILAYLRALQTGDEKTTEQSMEECYQLSLAEDAAQQAAAAQPAPAVEARNA